MQLSPPSISRSFHHTHHKFCTQESLTPHPLSLSLQPVVISVVLPALWICQQHVLANILGDWQGGWCIRIWELLDQIISRVPLGGGGFSCSVISDYLWPCGPLPARLLCQWDFPGKNTEWVAIPFSRWSSQPRDQTWVSCIADGFFTISATRDAPGNIKFF